MNKEQVITKINKIGSTGAGFALAFKIILGVLAGLTLLGAVSLTCLPKDMLDVGVQATSFVSVNLEKFGAKFSEEDQKLIEENLMSENDYVTSMSVEGHETGVASVDATETTLALVSEPVEYHINMRNLAAVVWGGFIALLAHFVLLFFISNVCKAFKTCESPFDANVIDSMKKLAIALIPWGIVLAIAEGLTEGFASGLRSFSFSVDLGVVFVILVIWALTTVFKYGAMLQQESDETL